MHYSISLQTTEFDFLSITPRKKLLKHSLLRVEDGLALVRLGKNEFVVEPGKVLWLPFDCLTSITYFPQTKASIVEVSSRVAMPMPKQAGFVKLNELASALLNRLITLNAPHEAKLDLYRVLLAELTTLQPSLKHSKLGNAIAEWKPNQKSELPKELQLALTVREARRRLLSGGKQQTVVDELFGGDDASFALMLESICGQSSFK